MYPLDAALTGRTVIEDASLLRRRSLMETPEDGSERKGWIELWALEEREHHRWQALAYIGLPVVLILLSAIISGLYS